MEIKWPIQLDFVTNSALSQITSKFHRLYTTQTFVILTGPNILEQNNPSFQV